MSISISSMMPFGKYRNWPLEHIPAAYFLEIYKQPDVMECHPDIKLYIEQKYSGDLPIVETKALIPDPLCETMKYCYIDEQAANKALRLIQQDKRQHIKPVRSYKCEYCGYWHHTKKPDTK